MSKQIGIDDVKVVAPVGHYLALRLGFAFPMEEINNLPPDWVEHYTTQRFMLSDPVIRWIYANVGAVRWSDIDLEDHNRVLAQARTFGLRFGLAVSVFDNNPEGQRSFGSFARADREFTEPEIRLLTAYVTRRHHEKAPPRNITNAEIEALRMVKDGLRLKQIAHELGVSEGAVKQRLKNAKKKLGAQTGAHAAALAADYGLI
ncbi:LuxR family transcriptional regulator [Roseisalinus antarcticus]|uniref:LuxR family transcriptional regulator n=1 Tax=Roseisalinus antarcticus TaxID=254357 RepID=UPI001F213FE8|nr:LuxR family transcriptional regulator [Roseisalinus antarcticus]